MTPIRQRLLDMILDPALAFDQPASDIEPLQLRAAQELFDERVRQIPLLARRAEEAGIARIDTLQDLVPLLFAHTVYKSYPPSFVEKGQWGRMLQWLQTLSVADVSGVDVDGVKDIDDWIARLWDAGHLVLATSGSSGKCSFLNHTRGDSALKQRHFRHAVGWPFVRANADRTVFWLGPLHGPNSACEAARFNAENFGRPGGTHALSDQPLRISEVSRMAALRKKMADGSASPGEIAGFEQEAARKAVEGRAAMLKLADAILDHRREPMLVAGMWAQYMMLIARARERGIGDGEFHPDTVVNAGGGRQGHRPAARLQGAGRPVLRPGRAPRRLRHDGARAGDAALRGRALPPRAGAACGWCWTATANGFSPPPTATTAWSKAASPSSTCCTRAAGAG